MPNRYSYGNAVPSNATGAEISNLRALLFLPNAGEPAVQLIFTEAIFPSLMRTNALRRISAEEAPTQISYSPSSTVQQSSAVE